MPIVKGPWRQGQNAGAGITRRAALVGGVGVAVGACSNGSQSASSSGGPKEPSPGWREISFEKEEQHALVFAPDGSADWPVLVALHGRGEAGRGIAAGARGWRDDYDLDLVRARLETNGLDAETTKKMLSEERLASIRSALTEAPWRGLVIATPYTPVPTGKDVASAAPFGRFVASTLLPRVAELKGGPVRREATGIDGVSMGGRYALQLGFSMPEVFGAVGALQPAIAPAEAPAFADLALKAAEKQSQHIRLASSSDDPFLEATMALAEELERRTLKHQLVVTAGLHDYIWNRGPGSAEMLFFHERALRGLSPP